MWLKGVLIDGIMENLSGLFDNVNTQVGEITKQVETTPAAWNAGGFSMIKQLSETAVLSIAGLVLAFVMCYRRLPLLKSPRIWALFCMSWAAWLITSAFAAAPYVFKSDYLCMSICCAYRSALKR